MDLQSLGLVAAALLCLYLWHVNRGLSAVPQEAVALSPTRFDLKSIATVHERLTNKPIQVDLPPPTGRRYIVLGGAGFLPGWIVVQLVARGEDPRRIRIVDVRPPTRQDLTTGPAAEVAFHQADVSDAESVIKAFTAPWPNVDDNNVPVTVFHSAANIRFWERVERFLPFSNRVNLYGTLNVIAASRKIGASILVYTSSASIVTKRTRFWLWPWQRYPKDFVQVLDDDSPLPSKHNEYFSNYAVSKAHAERAVREADRTPLSGGKVGFLRTGCIRPGNGVYGPGGDVIAGAYLVRQYNPTWVNNIIQSFVYVENCALAHLLYEQRLLEMEQLGHPDIGGQAFTVTDPNPPIAFSDVYIVLSTLTSGVTRFQHLPPVLMLALAHIVEAYYILRLSHPLISRILPQLKGEIIYLQPSVFSLTQIHLVFDDSRARKPPKDGGLGYQAPFTSLESLTKLVIEWTKEGVRDEERRAVGGRLSFGFGMETGWVKK